MAVPVMIINTNVSYQDSTTPLFISYNFSMYLANFSTVYFSTSPIFNSIFSTSYIHLLLLHNSCYSLSSPFCLCVLQLFVLLSLGTI